MILFKIWFLCMSVYFIQIKRETSYGKIIFIKELLFCLTKIYMGNYQLTVPICYLLKFLILELSKLSTENRPIW